jgi:hypothetical protein
LERLEDRSCPSINFVFDYSQDTSGFFNSAAARAVLEQAGRDLGAHLSDTLAAISPGGDNHWTATFDNPSGSDIHSVGDLSVPANTLYVFAGGQNFFGATVGLGGAGGWSSAGSSTWLNTVAARGQGGALGSSPTDFGPWGGSVTFSVDTNWNFGGAGVTPAWNQYDFYAVALHELGHVLGLGTAQSWDRLVSGGHFYGPNSYFATDGAGYPALDGSNSHWAQGTTSGGVEADMTPSITAGTLKRFTPLDWAGLADIGWQVDASMYAPVTRNFGSSAVPTGAETVGAFDRSTATWYLHNSLNAGKPDAGVSQYGAPGWIAVAGDWNGDGVVTLGVYDSGTGTWYLRNSNSPGAPDYTPFQYGWAGTIPVVGDWLGTGHTGIGVYDPRTATWYLRSTAGPGVPDLKPFQYGVAGWLPMVGDWANVGHTGIGVYNPAGAVWYLRNTASPGAPDAAPFQYGGAGWLPVAGDWTGRGYTSVGVVDPATETWYLRTTASAGAPDVAPFSYGGAGWQPVVGAWRSSGATPVITRSAPETAVPALTDPSLSYPTLFTEHRPSKPACGCPACLAAAGLLRNASPAGSGSRFLLVLSEQNKPSGTPPSLNSDAWIAVLSSEPSGEGAGGFAPFAGFGPVASDLSNQPRAWFASDW